MAQQTLFKFFNKGKGADTPASATKIAPSQVVKKHVTSAAAVRGGGKATSSTKALLKNYETKKRIRDTQETLFGLPAPTVAPSPATKKRKVTQSYIDAGQKSLTTVTCHECGLLYMKGEEHDEALHQKYHNSMGDVMKWKQKPSKEMIVWQGEDEFEDVLKVNDMDDDYIIKIDSRCDSKVMEKVRNIDIRVGSLLGCSLQVSVSSSMVGSAGSRLSSGQCIFVHVRRDKIIGFVTCERISYAFASHSLDSTEIERSCRTPCLMGIRRIWTDSKHRREGIASHLMNICRRHMIHGYFVPKQQIAFTYPTQDGKRFISRWMSEDETADKSSAFVCNIYVPEGLSDSDSGAEVMN